jgi:L-amino acid N-acyltransferase YncA
MIRAAVRADLPRLVEIYNASIPGRMATADLDPLPVSAREAWFAEHGPRWPLWVDEREGRVVGWASLSRFRDRSAYDISAELSIYVAPEAQRRGIAVGLVEHAVAAAPRLGIKNLIGLVFGHNAPSLALLDRFGFERWGVMPRVTVMDGVERDIVIVGLRVG